MTASLFVFGCGGPVPTVAMVFDGGFGALDAPLGRDTLAPDGAPDASGIDGGRADVDPSDADPSDVAPSDADPSDVERPDVVSTDGPIGDAGMLDAPSMDTDPRDSDGMDADPAPDALGDSGLDAGFIDAMPGVDADAGFMDAQPRPDGGDAAIGDTGVLLENFATGEFTCPDGTLVATGTIAEQGAQCLGVSGFFCPDEVGLDGPGSAICVDPGANPFAGGGQCVTTFFGCFNPAGACTNDGNGTFTWGNGARQVIMVDVMGRLIESRFFSSGGGATPCIIGRPGGSGAIYVPQ